MGFRRLLFTWSGLILTVCFFVCFHPVSTQEAYTYDLKVKYFANTSMICDHPQLNVSTRPQGIKSLSWVFPDGAAVDKNTPLNPRYFQLSESNTSLAAYNLTVFKVIDDVFGHYTCIVVYIDPLEPLSAIRWGLNVNGPDFTELVETFEENALIGGVAAAAVLVVVGSTCLVWHFRFSNQRKGDKEELEDLAISGNDVTKPKNVAYNNRAYVTDGVMVEIQMEAAHRRGGAA